MKDHLLEEGSTINEENVSASRHRRFGAIVAFLGLMTLFISTVLYLFIGNYRPSENEGSSSHAMESLDASDAFSKCYGYLGVSQEKLIHKPLLSAVLTADPGDFSGVSEAHHVLANLIGRRDKPRDETICGGVSSGVLLGRPAIVVTTGIGPSAASMCTLGERC